MNLRQSIITLALSGATIAAGAFGYVRYHQNSHEQLSSKPDTSIFKNASYTEAPSTGPEVDFEKAAAKASPAVVHIRTVMKGKQVAEFPGFGDDNPFKDFFGPFENKSKPGIVPKQKGSGSGVIISADGYIVTNNHVV